ncbi:MAG: hypothetical protein ACRDY3_00670 [Acidimicrobiales bacterium]
MVTSTWNAVGLSAELVPVRLSGMTVAGRPLVARRLLDKLEAAE